MRKLFVVGIGPGSYEDMTLRAQRVLAACDVIVGYTVYVELLREHFADKELIATPMRQEAARCALAFERASGGQTVAIVSSGDAGVYGMSGLVAELAVGYPDVAVDVVPGVSAAFSGAAILGAPLMHDFAVISLSDLLTPWAKISKRLACAAQADFVICLYNPASHRRKDYLRRACDCVLQYAAPDTVCGIAKNIGRAGEKAMVLPLSALRNAEVDMFSTVFIGNSQTKAIGNKMVTPRGYLHE